MIWNSGSGEVVRCGQIRDILHFEFKANNELERQKDDPKILALNT